MYRAAHWILPNYRAMTFCPTLHPDLPVEWRGTHFTQEDRKMVKVTPKHRCACFFFLLTPTAGQTETNSVKNILGARVKWVFLSGSLDISHFCWSTIIRTPENKSNVVQFLAKQGVNIIFHCTMKEKKIRACVHIVILQSFLMRRESNCHWLEKNTPHLFSEGSTSFVSTLVVGNTFRRIVFTLACFPATNHLE